MTVQGFFCDYINIAMHKETVLEIKHHSNRLFSFKTTRDKTFRFKNGEFCMMGLDVEPRPILRAYSIVSTNYDDYLEFLSIKVPDGPLTEKLQKINVGDQVIVNTKCTGSLVIDYVNKKQNLVMLSTGTGIAPFISIARDFETYDKFDNVYLFHSVRNVNELAYKQQLNQLDYPNFHYIETVTREKYFRPGRFWNYIPNFLEGGLNKDRDAVMVCGSPQMNKDCREMLKNQGWIEGNTGESGDFMLERAFAG